jgi:hypothetical protein
MKKFLFTVGLFSLVLAGKSQTVLNEIYVLPGNNHQEFFELYNSSTLPAGQSTDCFTILTYWEDNANTRGWYVMDLPNMNIGPKSFFVGAAANPFNTQSTTGSSANFNWNDVSFRNGSTGGGLYKYQVNGSGYTDISGTIPATLDDFLTGGQGQDYIVLVYVNGAFSNGFVGGKASGLLSGTTAAPIPGALTVTSNCGNFVVDFTALTAMEAVGSQPGSDNGYARSTDGKCGAWVKTSASVQHTPGVSNGSAVGLTGALTTTEVVQCSVAPNTSRINVDITAISGDVTLADDFAVDAQVYQDLGTAGVLDGADVLLGTVVINDVVSGAQSLNYSPQNASIIVVYKTKRGCFDRVVAVPNGCGTLPVSMVSFTALRNHSTVELNWATSWEYNNTGFYVERNTGAGWVQVAFVSSQALGGASNDMLSYSFNDINSVKGVSQYRIRQVDFDGKSKYSDIRAVRGEGMIGKTIVYPNPSNDGKVSVVFEDGNTRRDVSLIDMSGRTVKQWKGVTNNNIQIDNLTSGVYSLRIVIPETGEQSSEKIVVNKH